MIAGAGKGRKRGVIVQPHRLSVLQNTNVLETCCTTMWISLTPWAVHSQVLQVVNLMLRVFHHNSKIKGAKYYERHAEEKCRKKKSKKTMRVWVWGSILEGWTEQKEASRLHPHFQFKLFQNQFKIRPSPAGDLLGLSLTSQDYKGKKSSQFISVYILNNRHSSSSLHWVMEA